MKKFKVAFLVVSFLVFGVITNAYAITYTSLFDQAGTINRSFGEPTNVWNDTFKGYTGANYSGYYLGTFAGNDSRADIEDLITIYLGELFTSSAYYKADRPDVTAGPLSVTYGTANKIGTWTLDDPYALGFYAVKGSTEYALYYVNPYQSSGKWSTEHLSTSNEANPQQPAISHLSAAATTVPEPTTMLLLGLGLVGLAGVGRKLKK